MKITQVRKRDGRIVPFDEAKIASAIFKAAESVGGEDSALAAKLADQVVALLEENAAPGHIPHIEDVQDMVEKVLIENGHAKTAKHYILYRNERARLRERAKLVPEDVRQLVTESKKYFRNALAEFVYYRSYSRWIEGEGRRETWIESVDRYINFMRENIGSKLTEDEYREIREAILKMETMPSMRLLWSAGKAAAASNVCAYNCSYIAPRKLEDFAEIMYLSMCGAGVGFSVESQTVQELPIIRRQTGGKLPAHAIQDSKEGWCDALTLGLKTWYAGKEIDFDFSDVRPAGARLMTMGGRSSGPEPLRNLLEFSRRKILSKQGKRLSNIDVHDIVCKIGEVVVMGGVRRTALISLSDLDDEQMRAAKTGQFYLTEPQRSMANNSAVYLEKPTTTQFLDEWLALAKSGTGERGIFNRGALKKQLPARRWKLLGDHYETTGTNPCVTTETWITTSEGPKRVKNLIGKKFEAIVDSKPYYSRGFFHTGIKEVFEIRTDRGFSLKATADHPVRVVSYKSPKVMRTEWKKVGQLKPGDEIVLHNHRTLRWDGRGTREEGWLLGNLLGDGNIEEKGKANLDYWGEDQADMMQNAVALVHATVGGRSDLAGHIAKTGYARVGSTGLGQLATSYGMTYQNKSVTDIIEETSTAFHEGFLQGWFDADGSAQGTQEKGVSVRLSSNSLQNLEAAQRMLARLGIISTIYQNRREAGLRRLPDGRGGQKEYFCEADHELVISGENIAMFAERVNFSQPSKKSRLTEALQKYKRNLNREQFSANIKEINPAGIEPVYDCTIHDAHAFDANGVYVSNCGEIILRSKQFCNLTEIICRAEDTEESLMKKMRIATILGTYQSTLTNFPYLSKEWKQNCDEERLLGVSLTGQWDCPAVRNPETLKKLKEYAYAVNAQYAKRFGINQSACITCVKPSGTVSQLVDAASGMHQRHSKYYIRRIRIAAHDPLFQMLRDQKFPFHPEVGQTEGSAATYVLEFPVKAPEGAIVRNDLTALEQLEYWKMVKYNYCEHNPSVTISVGEDEWLETANWIYGNWDMLGGLSFLPRSNHVYRLAPFEEISKEKYEELVARMPPVDFANIVLYERDDNTTGSKELACVGGVCEFIPESAAEQAEEAEQQEEAEKTKPLVIARESA